jgi:hypothetical protein
MDSPRSSIGRSMRHRAARAISAAGRQAKSNALLLTTITLLAMFEVFCVVHAIIY